MRRVGWRRRRAARRRAVMLRELEEVKRVTPSPVKENVPLPLVVFERVSARATWSTPEALGFPLTG